MALQIDEFKMALREAAMKDFESVPKSESEIPYVFSPSFEKKMEKLLRNEKRVFWRFVNTAYKRAAVIILIIAMVFASALSIDAIREPIFDFAVEVYETFRHYIFPKEENPKDIIEYEYRFTTVPEGFTEIEYINNINSVSRLFVNESGDCIQLIQNLTEYSSFTIDNEKGVITQVFVNDKKVDIYESDGATIAIWTDDGYLLTLFYEGSIGKEQMIELIKLIQ